MNHNGRNKAKERARTEEIILKVLSGPDRSTLYQQSETCFDDPTNWFNSTFTIAKNDCFPSTIAVQVSSIERSRKGEDSRFDLYLSGTIFAQLSGSDCAKPYKFSGPFRTCTPDRVASRDSGIGHAGEFTIRISNEDAYRAREIAYRALRGEN